MLKEVALIYTIANEVKETESNSNRLIKFKSEANNFITVKSEFVNG
jgi:hypothetical protein